MADRLRDTSCDSGGRFGVVLGAGGVLGAAWMMGALLAFHETTELDARRAEVLVGTSAGSILAALLACGVSPEAMANHQRGVAAEGDPSIDYDYDGRGGGPLPPWPRLRLGSTRLLRATALRPWKVPPLTALAAVLPEGRASLAQVGAMVDVVAPDGPQAWAPHPGTWLVTMDYETGRRVAFGRPGAPPARLSHAVMASCAIPGWYAPVRIGGRRYVDGGSCSPTSADLVAGRELDTLYVFSPMTSFELDHPSGVGARLERRLRRGFTRRLARELAEVTASGTRVVALGPGPEDLRAIGINLMDPRRREQVFETSVRTSAMALARAEAGDADPLSAAG